MNYVSFFISLFLISFSGAASPGPVTAFVSEKGTKNPYAGFLISIGHGIIEIPLIILLFLRLGNFFKNQIFLIILGFFGGVFLVYMAFLILYNFINDIILKKTISSSRYKRMTTNENLKKEKIKFFKKLNISMNFSFVLAGIFFSLSNPYYFIWWATIGLSFISKIQEEAFYVLFTFIFIHWFADFIWFYFLSILSFTGHKKFGARFQKVISLISSFILLFFGIWFIYSSSTEFIKLKIH